MITFEERQAVVSRYLAAARDIVNRTAVEEIKISWGRFSEQYVVLAPTTLLTQPLPVTHPPRVGIVPIFPEDRVNNPSLNCLFPMGEVDGTFNDYYNSVLLPALGKGNNFWQGMEFLHEFCHVNRSHAEGRVGRDNPIPRVDRFLEEGDIHYMMAKLWREHGGVEYMTVLDQAVSRLAEVLIDQFGFVKILLEPAWWSVLDRVFEVTAYNLSQKEFLSWFVLHAHFEFLDRSHWSVLCDPRYLRAGLMDKFYELNGQAR